mmetsp:Transcript_4068/g.10336  ORF Transcript_4068/g.10336 Transcript_4068/m.10336 type:complete len:124 (+) Transcript_4068:479-850(+)
MPTINVEANNKEENADNYCIDGSNVRRTGTDCRCHTGMTAQRWRYKKHGPTTSTEWTKGGTTPMPVTITDAPTYEPTYEPTQTHFETGQIAKCDEIDLVPVESNGSAPTKSRIPVMAMMITCD